MGLGEHARRLLRRLERAESLEPETLNNSVSFSKFLSVWFSIMVTVLHRKLLVALGMAVSRVVVPHQADESVGQLGQSSILGLLEDASYLNSHGATSS